MTKALVERLRESDLSDPENVHEVCDEAAERIEDDAKIIQSLTAEIERLTIELARSRKALRAAEPILFDRLARLTAPRDPASVEQAFRLVQEALWREQQ